MQNKFVSQDMPQVLISVQLASSLSRITLADDPLHRAVHDALVQSLAELLETLGIPSNPIIQLSVLDLSRVGLPLRISVNGQLCRYPSELLYWVRSYILDRSLPPEKDLNETLIWLRDLCSTSPKQTPLHTNLLVEFLRLACLEIVKKQPEVLLGLPQATSYSASLADVTREEDISLDTWPPDPGWLEPILKRILQLKISIADKQKVAKKLWPAQKRSQEDISEDLITALRPDILELHLPQEYLKQLTMSDPKNELDTFSFLRESLLTELGMHYPIFRFVPSDGLKPNSFAFKLNHLTTLPYIGLLPNECLVNDTVERLQLLGIEGKATCNPANAYPGCIIDLSHKDFVEQKSLTTWTPLDHFILTFAGHLRQNSACFVHRQFAQEQLDQLSVSFPSVVNAVQLTASIEQISRVLRALVAEELSIGNLLAICERLLDYAYVVKDSSTRGMVLENGFTSYRHMNPVWLRDPIHMVSFVRAGMKRSIANKFARGTQTLVVYLLDEKIENLVLEYILPEQNLKERAHNEDDAILDALKAELAYLPPTAQRPAILTMIDIRPEMQEIIASEVPRISVLCYEELPCDLNVQPVARIQLT